MATPFKVIGPLFRANRDNAFRTFVNQGGTSSGKTYTIMQVLFTHAIEEPGCVITVCGQDLPNLKVGALRDAEKIIGGSEWLSLFFTVNKSSSTISGMNGSVIEFKSYEDEQDAKNGKRDYLFVNEANGVTYAIYWQLAIRTRKKVWLDYNPSARFWAHDEVMGTKGTRLIISDHRGNPFLTEEEHRRIETITDKELWEVYARGKTGKISGLVLTNWDIVDDMPPLEECRLQVFGLDFGFTNDPTALEEVRLAHGDLWIDEHIYETGLVNVDHRHAEANIVDRMAEAGITGRLMIVADSAEQKSIREIHNEGYWIVPSVKGQGSVLHGLDILRRYRIHFTRRSAGAIAEAKSYMWAKDREGNTVNKPVDKMNHAIDAIRYAVQMKLGQPQARGVTRRN